MSIPFDSHELQAKSLVQIMGSRDEQKMIRELLSELIKQQSAFIETQEKLINLLQQYNDHVNKE